MAFWQRFFKPASPVGLTSVDQGSFSFRGNPGHDFDTWTWPYVKPSTQYTYFNAQAGNLTALPSFNKFIPIIRTNSQVQPSWQYNTNQQARTALQNAHSGQTVLTFGQSQSANYMQASAAVRRAAYMGGV
jgi:hypothetical protein